MELLTSLLELLATGKVGHGAAECLSVGETYGNGAKGASILVKVSMKASPRNGSGYPRSGNSLEDDGEWQACSHQGGPKDRT